MTILYAIVMGGVLCFGVKCWRDVTEVSTFDFVFAVFAVIMLSILLATSFVVWLG